MKVHGPAGERDAPYARDAHNKSSISRKSRKGLPSLSDISKRLAGNDTVSRAEPMGTARGRLSPSVNRLPAFLKRASMETMNEGVVPTQQGEKQQLGPITKDDSIGRPRIQGVGRLAFTPVPGAIGWLRCRSPQACTGPFRVLKV